MSKLGDAFDRIRTKLDSKATRILPDLCDILEIGLVDDGFSGQKPGETPVATDIPVEVAEATPSSNTIVSGDVTYTGTHRLKFGWNETTAAINPKQIIKVAARGDESQMVFEQPVREKGSSGVWVYVLAKLSIGYRQPANV